MRTIKFFIILLALFIAQEHSIAQCTFRITSLSGASFTNPEQTIYGPYPNFEICTQNRNYVLDNLNFSIGSHRVKASASPCACAGNSSSESIAPGPSNGTSFYSTNKANEVHDWSEDDMERMLALNSETSDISPSELSMGDNEANLARNQARYTAFRSLNITDEGDNNYHSNDFDNFEPIWQMEKRVKNLPFESVEEYRRQMLSEANDVIQNLYREFGLNEDDLKSEIAIANAFFNQELISYEDNFTKQQELLEKVFQLAQYKVEYKYLMIMDYMEKHPQNPDPMGDKWEKLGTKLAETVPFPWMKEYQEKYVNWDKKFIESREKELTEKYGISADDIASMKANVDNDNFIANYASTASETLSGAKSASQLVLNPNDAKDKGFLKNLFFDAKSSVVPMVVAATDWIKAKDYETQRDNITEARTKLESSYLEAKSNIQKRKEKADAISFLLNVTSRYNQDNANGMNKHEQLKLANNITSAISSIRETEYSDNKEGDRILFRRN